MEWWYVAGAADGVVAVSYLGISYAVFVPLLRAGELRTNRLGAATALIFFTCAVGHGLHALRPSLPFLGVAPAEDHGRSAVELHDALWAVVTACVGIYYWTLRRSYGRLLQGPTVFHDQGGRQGEALDVNDDIVQSLVRAKLARQLGRDDEADAALDSALAASRELVSRLLRDAQAGEGRAPVSFVRQAEDRR